MGAFNDGLLYFGKYRITSDFGQYILNGVVTNHKGIDLVGDESKYILSPVDGKVVSSTIVTDKSNLTWQWGHYVRVDSGLYKYYFCHLSKRLVNVGDIVKKGNIIGIEGSTGYSFGSHCHLEIRDINNYSIDPKSILWSANDSKEVREMNYINLSDMPEWMQAYVLSWVNKGFIIGNTKGELNLTDDMIRTLIIAERMINQRN